MTCVHCGKPNPDGAVSCIFCGDPMVLYEAPEARVTPRPSGLAIASLVLGILGLFSCGVTALIGLILGIVNLVQIQKSHDRLQGKALALASIAVSIGMMGLGLMAFSTITRTKESARAATCMANLKQVGLALLMYAEGCEEVLPPPGVEWGKVLWLYPQGEVVLRCPSDRDLPSYQLNPSLRGLGLSRIPNPAWTVAIFESDDEKNIVYRHDDRTNYAFMDGHVKQYQRGHEEELIWNLRREDLTTTAHSGKGER